MSDLQRWSPGDRPQEMYRDDEGEWVLYDEHIEALQSEVSRLQREKAELEDEVKQDNYTIDDLNHQIEGLRSAIDSLSADLEAVVRQKVDLPKMDFIDDLKLAELAISSGLVSGAYTKRENGVDLWCPTPELRQFCESLLRIASGDNQ